MLPHRYNEFTSEVERTNPIQAEDPSNPDSNSRVHLNFSHLHFKTLTNTCSEEHFHQHYETHFVLGLILYCMFILWLKPLLFVSMNLRSFHIIQWLLDFFFSAFYPFFCVLSLFSRFIKGLLNGFPCRIAWSMHAGCYDIFGKLKNTRAAGECIFTLSENRVTFQVHGSHYPARKTISVIAL